MKVKELIRDLQNCLMEHGNFDVTLCDPDTGWQMFITGGSAVVTAESKAASFELRATGYGGVIVDEDGESTGAYHPSPIREDRKPRVSKF